MGCCRTLFKAAVRLSVVVSTILAIPSTSGLLHAQETDRIWGRVTTRTGEVHEGFIRWDRNEGSWVDVLDGSKDSGPIQFVDWWNRAHPEDRFRDRVIELAGYRITWDDDEPDFPDSHESGVRFGHIRRLTVTDDDRALLTLHTGRVAELWGGSSDLGRGLRELLVIGLDGNVAEMEWEDLETVDFFAAPGTARARGQRLYGTVEAEGGRTFSGFIGWDLDEILTTDTLVGYLPDGGRREILFGRISAIDPADDGATVVLRDGQRLELSGAEDVDDENDGIEVSDPGLGRVEMDWEDLVGVRFHAPENRPGLDRFDGGRRLRGTVVTTDSTELTGWIRWDGDEEYSWELLDGSDDGLLFDVEFGQIASIERRVEVSVGVNLGPTGADVESSRIEGAKVTLRDGRVLELAGSNDVDDSNGGIFVLEDGSGGSPDDPETEWVMVKWGDFREVRFEWGVER
jgi:hypothetical protein